MTFWLAEKLGCFAADIDERMDAGEFIGWLKYFRGASGMKQLPKSATGIMAELAKIGIQAR